MLASLCLTVALASAQQALPICFVVGEDQVYLLTDVNGDGDYRDVGESTLFADLSAVAGPGGSYLELERWPDGSLAIPEFGSGRILRVHDIDGDGDALDAGEVSVWYEEGPGRPDLANCHTVAADGESTLLALGGDGSRDYLLRLIDANSDGDALDAGEATVVLETSSDERFTEVRPGPEGDLYLCNLPVQGTTWMMEGILRLHDADGSGTIDPLTEVSAYASAIGTETWGMGFVGDVLYAADTSGMVHRTWRFEDLDGNGDALGMGEATIHWDHPTNPTAATYLGNFEFYSEDRAIYVDVQPPAGTDMFAVFDADADGVIGPGEFERVSMQNEGPPIRGTALGLGLSRPRFGTVDCNAAAPNSTGQVARAMFIGDAWLASPSIGIRCEGLPPGVFTSFLTSRALGPAMPISPTSQGLLCLAAPIGKMNDMVMRSSASGMVQRRFDVLEMPQPGGSVGVMVGESWSFQCWYRDLDASSMPTSNLSTSTTVLFR